MVTVLVSFDSFRPRQQRSLVTLITELKEQLHDQGAQLDTQERAFRKLNRSHLRQDALIDASLAVASLLLMRPLVSVAALLDWSLAVLPHSVMKFRSSPAFKLVVQVLLHAFLEIAIFNVVRVTAAAHLQALWWLAFLRILTVLRGFAQSLGIHNSVG